MVQDSWKVTSEPFFATLSGEGMQTPPPEAYFIKDWNCMKFYFSSLYFLQWILTRWLKMNKLLRLAVCVSSIANSTKDHLNLLISSSFYHRKKKHILGVFLHTIFLEGKLNDFYDLLIIKKNFSLYVFCIPLCTASCNASVVVWLMIEWEALAQETVLETSVQKTVIGNTGTFSM